jgi:hypothetical protein
VRWSNYRQGVTCLSIKKPARYGAGLARKNFCGGREADGMTGRPTNFDE